MNYGWLMTALRRYLLGEMNRAELGLNLAHFTHDDGISGEAVRWRNHVARLYLYTTDVREKLREEAELVAAVRGIYMTMRPYYEGRHEDGGA